MPHDFLGRELNVAPVLRKKVEACRHLAVLGSPWLLEQRVVVFRDKFCLLSRCSHFLSITQPHFLDCDLTVPRVGLIRETVLSPVQAAVEDPYLFIIISVRPKLATHFF